eukprot:1550932-Amphidinium_carterae.1
MGCHCRQSNGMTTLDGMPSMLELWNDNSGWDAIDAGDMGLTTWEGFVFDLNSRMGAGWS